MVYVGDEYGREQCDARIVYMQRNLAYWQSVVAGLAQHADYIVSVFVGFAHIIRKVSPIQTDKKKAAHISYIGYACSYLSYKIETVILFYIRPK